MSRSPGIEKARIYILDRIEKGALHSATRLPSVKALAPAAQVSPITMWKAMKALAAENILLRKGGNRYWANPEWKGRLADEFSTPNFQSQHTPLPRTAWERAKACIEKDILNALYAPGETLAPPKLLQKRYGISYPTLKKALDTLANEGMLVPVKRGYAVAGYPVARPYAKLVCFGLGLEGGTLCIGSREREFYRNLEITCARTRLAFDIGLYSYVVHRNSVTECGDKQEQRHDSSRAGIFCRDAIHIQPLLSSVSTDYEPSFPDTSPYARRSTGCSPMHSKSALSAISEKGSYYYHRGNDR